METEMGITCNTCKRTWSFSRTAVYGVSYWGSECIQFLFFVFWSL